MVIVSACLAGFCCRYDGKSNRDERVVDLVRSGRALPVCPEQLGGLATPRNCCEIRIQGGSRRVINSEGQDVTGAFERGALEVAKLAEIYGIRCALLQERSPSCGVNRVYDGTFSGKLIPGKGITAGLLEEKGVILFTPGEMDELVRYLTGK